MAISERSGGGVLRTLLPGLKLLGLTMLLFSVGRVLFVLLYPEPFEAMTAAQLARGFARGSVFDLSIVLSVMGVPLFLMSIPLGARTGSWRRFWGWICFVLFLLFALGIAGDLIYFPFAERHVGPELVIATDNLSDHVDLLLSQHLLSLLFGLAGAIGLFLLWRRVLRSAPTAPPNRAALAVILVAVGGLVFVGARGGIGEERLKVEDAYAAGDASTALLVLNGPFSAIHLLMSTGFLRYDFYPEAEALSVARGLAFSPGEDGVSSEFPMLRHRPRQTSARRPNVLVIMLEGWSAASIDSIRETMGLAPLGITPNFDALSREGVLFSRFYATAQRTRQGLTAVLTGFPSIPNMPYIGRGLEQMRLPYLGEIATQEGYGTIFFNPERKTSRRSISVVAATGFEHFVSEFGREGRTLRDQDLLMEANRLMAGMDEPFLAFVHTPSPHAPYITPKGPWNRFHNQDQGKRYWNALGYSDWALGEFIAAAKREAYYWNSVLFVLSDHIQRKVEQAAQPPDLFHIPGLVIAPGLEPRVDPRVGSQIDVIPTIVHLAGWGAPHGSFGRSLFDDEAGAVRGANSRFGDTVVRVEAGGWVHHTMRRRVAAGAYRPDADLEGIERRLLATLQAATQQYLHNRLYPDAPASPRVATPRDPEPAENAASGRAPRARRMDG